MIQKVVKTYSAISTETVRIRWFLVGEGGYYDEEYTCPPKETRKARKDDSTKSNRETDK